MTTISFDDIGLHDSLLRGVYGLDMTTPSPIQRLGIPTICGGNTGTSAEGEQQQLSGPPTYYLHAPSGTGKTVACIISSLQKHCISSSAITTTNAPTYRTLHITQTREICIPTSHIYRGLVKYMSDSQPVMLCLDSAVTKKATTLTASSSTLADRSRGSNCDLYFKDDIDRADIVITTQRVLLSHLELISPSTFDTIIIDDMDEIICRNGEGICVQLLSIIPNHTTVIMAGATALDERVGTHWPLRKVHEMVVKYPRNHCVLEDYAIYQVRDVIDEFMVETVTDIVSMWPGVTILVCESVAAAVTFHTTHEATFLNTHQKRMTYYAGESWVSIDAPNPDTGKPKDIIEKSMVIFNHEPSLESLTRTLAQLERRVHAVAILTPTHADQLAKLLNIDIPEVPHDFAASINTHRQITVPNYRHTIITTASELPLQNIESISLSKDVDADSVVVDTTTPHPLLAKCKLYQVFEVPSEHVVETTSDLASLWGGPVILVLESVAEAASFCISHADSLPTPLTHDVGERWVSVGTQPTHSDKGLILFSHVPSVENISYVVAQFEGRQQAVVILASSYADELAAALNTTIPLLPPEVDSSL